RADAVATARSAYPPVPFRLATTRAPDHGLSSPTVPPTPLPRTAGSAGSIDGCGGRPARTCVSTNVTLANSTSITASSGPARASATSAGSSTSGGPNSRITTARTPGLLREKVLPRQTSLKVRVHQHSGLWSYAYRHPLIAVWPANEVDVPSDTL